MPQEKSERELLVQINEKLDQLIALVAAHGASQDRKIEVLSGLGLDSNFISSIVGMSPSAVRKAKSRLKKRRARKRPEATP